MSSGLFLERPGILSGPVSHPVSPRKLYVCFSKLPLFFDPVNFPGNLPGNLRSSWLPVKLPGTKLNKMAAAGGLVLFSAKTTVLLKTPLSCRYAWLWVHWTIPSLSGKNRVACRRNEGGIGKKHGETLPTLFGSAGKYFQKNFCMILLSSQYFLHLVKLNSCQYKLLK